MLPVRKLRGDWWELNEQGTVLVGTRNGGAIRLVMVAGEIVVREGQLTRIDEATIRAELAERLPAYLDAHGHVEARNRVFEPYMLDVHRRSSRAVAGLNRYAGDLPPWRRRNAAGSP